MTLEASEACLMIDTMQGLVAVHHVDMTLFVKIKSQDVIDIHNSSDDLDL